MKVVALLLGGFVLTLSGASSTGAQGASLREAGCPKPADVIRYAGPAPESLLRAVRRDVPRRFSDSVGYGVYGLVSLSAVGSSATPGWAQLSAFAGRFRTLAARRCGVRTAAASWLVFLQFPRRHFIASDAIAFYVPTRAGWLLWWVG